MNTPCVKLNISDIQPLSINDFTNCSALSQKETLQSFVNGIQYCRDEYERWHSQYVQHIEMAHAGVNVDNIVPDIIQMGDNGLVFLAMINDLKRQRDIFLRIFENNQQYEIRQRDLHSRRKHDDKINEKCNESLINVM
jgi:hypothetical protein